jgi:hypothetical protein
MSNVIPQPTPNPQAYKFTIEGHRFAAPVTIGSAAAAADAGAPFDAVFAVPGVASIFATANFVTVTKQPSAAWDAMLPAVRTAIESAYTR